MDLLHFFDLDQFQAGDILVILTLIVLEGLLSCDNAVALAMIVRQLPKEQQGKALRYGIIGAYAFLFIAILLATWIISQWWLKVLGGLYLLWIAGKHLLGKKPDELDGGNGGHATSIWRIPGLGLFWSAVVTVELTDIAFSVDSVAAAIALSHKFYVLLIAGMIYILVMRFAAQGFIKLLQVFPRLETCAFIAVAIIGLKLVVEIPGDIFGRSHAFAPTVEYATRDAYKDRVAELRRPVATLPHAVEIHTAAAPRPEAWRFLADARVAAAVAAQPTLAEAIEDQIKDKDAAVALPDGTALTPTKEQRKEFRLALSDWNLHQRPLIRLESWFSSVLIIVVFAFGFIGRRRRDP
jgi:YkoY family integral membrane protein